MLVLARRLNERILIPCIRAAVRVVSIHNGQVRLGVEAPPEVAVFREEIYSGRPPAAAAAASDGAAHPARPHHPLRARLNDVGLGLARLCRRLRGQLPPDALAALKKVRDEFDALAEKVRPLLTAADPAALPVEPAACAQL
jgi:carbon storage regulator